VKEAKRHKGILKSSQKGFTLLEVMIAFALLTGILFVAVLSQSSSLLSSTRSKNILIATNLARNIMSEMEVKYESVAFDQLPKEEKGQFDAPNQAFKWELKFEEVDFAILSELIAKQAEAEKKEQEANTETLIRLFEEYLKKSVRRMNITVEYPDENATAKLSFTQLLVNYDAEFATGM
jgi:prepilin-type N-terminal cleavage/methylation domain-containing protein